LQRTGSFTPNRLEAVAGQEQRDQAESYVGWCSI